MKKIKFPLFLSSMLFFSPVVLSETKISINPYLSNLNFKYSIDSSRYNSDFGSPTSKLDFKELKSAGLEIRYLNIKSDFYKAFTLYGNKGNSDGTLLDSDWYSYEKALEENGPELFSQTESETNLDYMTGLNISGGWVIDKRNQYRLGGFLSYSRGTFDAYGISVIEDPYKLYDQRVFLQGQKVISIENRTFSLGFDFGLLIPIQKDLYFNFESQIAPLVYVETKDQHHQRKDLKSPGIELESLAYSTSIKAQTMLKFDDIELGLWARYFYLKNYGEGNATFFFTNNEEVKVDVDSHEMNKFDYGISLSLYF